jgi:hypothetical protein
MFFSGYERIGSKGKSESPGAFTLDTFGNPFSKLSPDGHLLERYKGIISATFSV